MQFTIVSILALAAPFFLWFPERVLGIPYVLEEAAKVFLVSLLPVNTVLKRKIVLALCLGVFFSLSELVLYTFNFGSFGQGIFFERLFIVGLMHSVTFAIIAISGHKKRSGLIFGFILASLIHFFFNRHIGLTL